MHASRRPTQRTALAGLLLLALLVGACASRAPLEPGSAGTGPTAATPAPDAATAPLRAGVAAAHPIAVQAGLDVLAAGGSAADAAVAVQAALGLVEPQSSGLGGGAFLLYYDARTRTITAFDGREAAPAGATPDMFLDDTGTPLDYPEAVTSGRATGVPGAVAMLGEVQRRYGKLPWSDLFDASIEAADHGFVVPRRLARFANSTYTQATLPDARAMFTKTDGQLVQAGETMRNPAYAATLRTLAAGGSRTLLEGPLAAAIVARVGQEPRPGTLTADDLAAYLPRVGEPVCLPFRVYLVCVPPPPSSGVSLLQLLGLLERTDIAARGPDDPQAWFLFAEASRLMYADRDQFIADPQYVRVPVDGLIDPLYLDQRAGLIGARASAAAPAPGTPPGVSMTQAGRDATTDVPGTSHFVVVDAEGDVVSMTTSVESLFGSGRAVGGFFLNNQLTDFSFRATDDQGRTVANAIAAGKRPRSSMSPVIVLRRADRAFVAALGSPGGSAILAYNAKALVGLLLWDLPLQQAFDLPNIIARGTDVYGETSKISPELAAGLSTRGMVLKSGRGEESGLHGVALQGPGRTQFGGAADRRREGAWAEVAGQSPGGRGLSP